ncbi:Peptidase inhibitor 16 [Mizuhopecten yessoensis]|uniref:Peptidase inhibitor 16 n=2 Tax=Mizuhopecten yessoensis TaxID=6573 RepID=A0A210QMH3_MIZYE|nr:Peptidase inhibitor 16 [Mizuhopecten yessoensis]
MKALTVLSLHGMLIVAALCQNEESDLRGAGAMPPESEEIMPPDIQDDKRSDTDKRSQNLDLKIRALVKTILDQRRLAHAKRGADDVDEEEEVVAQEKRGNRRNNQERGNKQRKGQQNQRQEIPDERNVVGSQVTSMKAAQSLFMKGEETPIQVSQAERDDTVDVHQRLRKMEHGTDIWKIDWDDSLARLGQALADKCVFKHTNLYFANGTRVGQNLAIVKGSNHSIEKVAQLFYNEKGDYDMVGHSWVDYDLVGHYLQVVYWDTVKVGCGLNFCPTLYLPDTGAVWNNAWYWACDYWPPLHTNTRPYHVGDPCSECVVPVGKGFGWKCEENICEDCTIGDAGCNEAGPCTSFDPDVKSKAICDKVQKHKYCEKGSPGYKFAKLYCKTTCQFCRGIPESMDNTK